MAEVSKAMKKKMEERNKELSTRGGGKIPFFTIKEGTTRMRTLPVPKDEEFALEANYVFISKEAGGFISPTTFNKKCAWTEKYDKLAASKDPQDKILADRMKPKKKFFSPHIKYTDELGKVVNEQSGVKLLILTNKLYQAMIDYFLDDDYGDMTDPLEGYDFKYKRKGTTMLDTEYSVRPCKTSKLPKQYRKIYDIKAMMMEFVPSYEETQAKVKEFLKSGIDEDEPSSASKKKKKKKKTSDIN